MCEGVVRSGQHLALCIQKGCTQGGCTKGAAPWGLHTRGLHPGGCTLEACIQVAAHKGAAHKGATLGWGGGYCIHHQDRSSDYNFQGKNSLSFPVSLIARGQERVCSQAFKC